MSLFDPHNADPDWQRLFGEAADTPPSRVWDAIERALDDETDSTVLVIPFWRRSVVQRLAAAVVVLVAGGLLVSQQLEKGTPVADTATKAQQMKELSTNHVDKRQKSSQNVDKVGVTPVTPQEHAITGVENRDKLNRQRPMVAYNQSIDKATATDKAPAPAPVHIARESNTTINQKITRDVKPGTTDERVADSELAPIMAPVKSSAIALTKLPDMALTKSPEITLPTLIPHEPLRVDLLPSPTWATRVQVATHEPAIEPQEPTSSPKSRGRWLSVSAGQAAFQPSVALRSQPASSVSNAVKGNVSAPTSGLSLGSQPGAATSILAVAGFQLSSRWFVEGGAGYQQAQATVVSPGQTVSSFAQYNSSSTSLYADALQGFPQPSQAMAGVQTNQGSMFDNRSQVVRSNEQRNTYQFGQATAQLGYQLRPRKRLGIAALGGLIANLFVKNAVENGPVIRATNAVYRPVSVAGLGGLRFRYRASGRWSVSMAGLYQYSLSSITQPGALLSVQPQNMSVNGSLDYHF